MPSILAFFQNNKNAYHCMNDLKKIMPKESKVYTVAQYEYQEDKTEILQNRGKSASKIGAFVGLFLGAILSISSSHIFSRLSHFSVFILIILLSAAGGSLIGFLISSSIKSKINYHKERGELILIVENPGDKKEEMTEIIKQYHPDKLTLY